jgi:hypothetical protein
VWGREYLACKFTGQLIHDVEKVWNCSPD